MAKNKVEVIIGGSIYTLQGEESQEHMQKVASLIDKKIVDVQKNTASKNLTSSQVNMLAAINFASDYIKTEEELVAYRVELEKYGKENDALVKRVEEMGLEIARLKTKRR